MILFVAPNRGILFLSSRVTRYIIEAVASALLSKSVSAGVVLGSKTGSKARFVNSVSAGAKLSQNVSNTSTLLSSSKTVGL